MLSFSYLHILEHVCWRVLLNKICLSILWKVKTCKTWVDSLQLKNSYFLLNLGFYLGRKHTIKRYKGLCFLVYCFIRIIRKYLFMCHFLCDWTSLFILFGCTDSIEPCWEKLIPTLMSCDYITFRQYRRFALITSYYLAL